MKKIIMSIEHVDFALISFTVFKSIIYQVLFYKVLFICPMGLIAHGVLAHFGSGLLVSSSCRGLKEETELNTKPSAQGM